MAASTRVGRYIQQANGFRAFVPAALPPDPPIQMDAHEPLLSEASAAVGRLDGSASTLLNPDLFVAMYVRREAVLSSQIPGRRRSGRQIADHLLVGISQHARYAAPLSEPLPQGASDRVLRPLDGGAERRRLGRLAQVLSAWRPRHGGGARRGATTKILHSAGSA